jgi:hypothetical protein
MNFEKINDIIGTLRAIDKVRESTLQDIEQLNIPMEDKMALIASVEETYKQSKDKALKEVRKPVPSSSSSFAEHTIQVGGDQDDARYVVAVCSQRLSIN